MEKSKTIDTAEELLDFLQSIPREQLSRLPVMVGENYGDVYCYAYETTETQGNIERGLQLTVEE